MAKMCLTTLVTEVVSMLCLCCLYVVTMLSLCRLYVVSMLSLCCLYVVSMPSLCRLYDSDVSDHTGNRGHFI